MRIGKVMLILLFLHGSAFVYAQDSYNIRNQIGSAIKAGTDSLKIELLFKLAYDCYDRDDNIPLADSISELAIGIAVQSRNPRLLYLGYVLYLESNDLEYREGKAKEYGQRALILAKKLGDPALEWRALHDLSQVYLASYKYDIMLDYNRKALSIAAKTGNLEWRALSHLDQGRCMDSKNRKLDAFNNYMNAMEIAEKTNDTSLMIRCYSELSRFFNLAKLIDQAKEYKEKEEALMKLRSPEDSLALMWIVYDYGVIDCHLRMDQVNEKQMLSVIDFAIRHNYSRLRNWEFGIYRQYLIDTDQRDHLFVLYNKLYPGEFSKLLYTNPGLYYRLQGFFAEIEGDQNSAEKYFNRASDLLDKGSNLILQSNFHRRYGQYLLRHGKDRKALDQFTLAYKTAENSTYSGKFEYMLYASRELKKLYYKEGDFRNAYFYATRISEMTDTITSNSKKDQLVMKDITRLMQQRERAAELEKQKAERTIRHQKTQRNSMAGGVAVLLVFSYLVYRTYRNQKRLNRLLDAEKQKSDDLLLNILPYVTAEELKLTGTAKAKKYKEVTVMFTDFKDFTQASEKMTPEELVAIINSYFTEFDKIITKAGIEKIKIIGDSYMCAGGLPVANDTHAYDVVKAALQLQAFMQDEKERRILNGEFFFELRVGIHTGPVIAGIVGLKKFAYDIWGDTVNTASRMENSGEVNKVNISGSTYQRVKHRFICTYRGKVEAKHKGVIDMYFVSCGLPGDEGPSAEVVREGEPEKEDQPAGTDGRTA